jgi:hypothetical protein
MACAGGLLVAVGCAFQLGNTTVDVGVKVNEQVVSDTLTNVAQRIQNEMQRLGLQVAFNSEGDTVRLSSTTRGGQRFVVVLSRVRGDQGEQTRIHIDWDQASDKELWLQLILVAGQTAVSAR